MTELLPVIATSHDTGWSAGLTLISLVLGTAALVAGRNVWRGKELAYIVEHQREHGPHSTPFMQGGIRLYKTVFGSVYTFIPAGLGLILVAMVEIFRSVAGLEPDGILSYIAGYVMAASLLVSLLWNFTYVFIGIPDWMRPPAQRGWELTKDGYVLARPEARVVDDFERAQIERERQEAERRARNRAARTAELDAWATGDDPWKDHDPWN